MQDDKIIFSHFKIANFRNFPCFIGIFIKQFFEIKIWQNNKNRPNSLIYEIEVLKKCSFLFFKTAKTFFPDYNNNNFSLSIILKNGRILI